MSPILTWKETQPVGNENREWVKSLSNTDGNILLAIFQTEYYEYVPYLSVDGGDTWDICDPSGVGYTFYRLVMSDNGQTMFAYCANVDTPYLYISFNAGTSWSQISIPAGDYVVNIDISGDGLELIISMNFL